MINHARTLLLNKPGKFYQPGAIGEEYIPADYSSVVAPSYIRTPYRIIFGVDPDRAFLNYRLYEIFSLIHQTELSELVYALDPRVTYWPQTSTAFFTSKFQPTLKKTGGLPGANMSVTGSIKADNVQGRALYEYFVRVIDTGAESTALITSAGQDETQEAVISWVASYNDGGPSQLIPIGTTGLTAQFSSFVATSQYGLLLEDDPGYLLLQDGGKFALTAFDVNESLSLMYSPAALLSGNILAQWELSVYAQPENCIKFVLPKLELLGEPLFLELFGLDNVEPFATLKNIWFDHPIPAYRLCAFVLAMVYRLNQISKAST